ncbi:MAG: hypothetical protein C5B53_10185 [Candidatus Melainabacteria bacterium]|nr:MAG: hypothetical protein C5B53_10185 [Candidatus Melainabacteria bacterium]
MNDPLTQKATYLQSSRFLQEALDRSEHELRVIATLYHKHGHTSRAEEIYRAVQELQFAREAKFLPPYQ